MDESLSLRTTISEVLVHIAVYSYHMLPIFNGWVLRSNYSKLSAIHGRWLLLNKSHHCLMNEPSPLSMQLMWRSVRTKHLLTAHRYAANDCLLIPNLNSRATLASYCLRPTIALDHNIRLERLRLTVGKRLTWTNTMPSKREREHSAPSTKLMHERRELSGRPGAANCCSGHCIHAQLRTTKYCFVVWHKEILM